MWIVRSHRSSSGAGAPVALALQPTDARRKATAEHREGGEVNLRVAVGVSVMLLEGQITLIVEQTIENVGNVPVSAFDGRTVERA
jgi:hypothetical protein